MLFHHNIVFCFEFKDTDLFLSVSCVIKWKTMLPLHSDQILLLSFDRYAQVFFITTTCL